MTGAGDAGVVTDPDDLAASTDLAALTDLAVASGIEVEWTDQTGRPQVVAPRTVRAVLAALGVPAGDADEVATSLKEQRAAALTRPVPDHVILRAGAGSTVTVRAAGTAAVSVHLLLEDGGRLDLPAPPADRAPGAGVPGDDSTMREYTVRLPDDLPAGYHELVLVGPARAPGDPSGAPRCPVVVAPARLAPPAGGRRVFGITAQLYSVRSAASWGTGDLADLAELATWAGAEHGAAFVAVNPLCAGAPTVPREDSPYLPTTKRFTDPGYLSVQAIPEFGRLSADARRRVDALAATVAPDTTTVPADPLTDPDGTAAGVGLLDRNASWTARSSALRLVFEAGRAPDRQQLLDDFVRAGGSQLRDWARWCVLALRHGADTRAWPEGLDRPDAPAVEAAVAATAGEVDFHLWQQWCLAEQLDAATGAARAAGMAVGIIHDLPIGVHAGGADTWTLPGVFAEAITVGAPPDMYNQQGQDWSAPPMRPDRLRGRGLQIFRDQIRWILRYAGGVRIDHVLGLFRLWWVPAGLGPGAGAFVRYDHDALISVLILEATRAGAAVVGEDLGTVAAWVQEYLSERGVLGTSILWFEHGDDGGPRPPERWRAQTMGSVTVHDLPPTAGYLDGEHIRLRAGLGLLTRPASDELADDEADRARWFQALRVRGLWGGEDVEALVLGLHRYLAATPVALVAVGLPDAVGDRRVQNLPGTSAQYPNWRLPLTGPTGLPLLLEEVRTDARAARLLDAVRAAMPAGDQP